MEIVTVKIHELNKIVVAFYSSPNGSFDNFMDLLDKCLSYLINFNRNIHFEGNSASRADVVNRSAHLVCTIPCWSCLGSHSASTRLPQTWRGVHDRTCEAEVADHSAVILHVLEQKVISKKFLNHNSWHGVYNLLSRKLFKRIKSATFGTSYLNKMGFLLYAVFQIQNPDSVFFQYRPTQRSV